MLTPAQLREFPWKHLSWLIVNEGELGDLLLAFGSSANPGEAKEDELQAKASAGILELHENDYFSKNVGIICTLGAKGILCYEPGKEVGYLPAAKLQNPVKDTTGAGDCFAGYFVAGLMSGKSLQDALKTCLVVSNLYHIFIFRLTRSRLVASAWRMRVLWKVSPLSTQSKSVLLRKITLTCSNGVNASLNITDNKLFISNRCYNFAFTTSSSTSFFMFQAALP